MAPAVAEIREDAEGLAASPNPMVSATRRAQTLRFARDAARRLRRSEYPPV